MTKANFQEYAPLRSCTSKINNTLIDNTEDPDIVMPMYNLLEYIDRFSMTLESFCNYYGNEVNDSADETDDNDNMINNSKTRTSKSIWVRQT